MKLKPELSLRRLADEPELAPRHKLHVDPLFLSAVWGGKKSGPSKPPGWTSSTLMTTLPVWHASTTH